MTSHRSSGRVEARDRKKVYRAPRTLSREKLEALAIVCDPGKTDGLPPDCNLNNQS